MEQRYGAEIGRKENISEAIDELCGITSEAHQSQSQVKTEGRDIIDLTLDDDDDDNDKQVLRSSFKSRKPCLYATQGPEDNRCNFAEDERVATLRELLECLQYEELKDLGKEMKVLKAGQNVGVVVLMFRPLRQCAFSVPLYQNPLCQMHLSN